MTRPNLLVGALSAVCVGTLLWCAWLILSADLPVGARVAAWALWLVSTAAVGTLLAYLREFLSHRRAVGRDASWKPLPSLVLLWIGGLTALVSFAFILPDSSSGAAEGPTKAGTSLTSQTASTATTGTSTPRGSTTTAAVSRSASRTTAPSSTSTSGSGTSPKPVQTSSSASTAPTPTTSTTTPIIDLDILPTQARPTTPPGH